jgi:integrase
MTLPKESAHIEKMPFAKGELDILWSAWNEKKSALLGVILLSVYTGAMPIEVCRMKTENVQDRMIVDVGAKTEKRKESPIVIPNLLMPIVEWLCSNSADGYLLGMTEKQYRTEFKREMARLGLSTDHTPYDCRHTTATLLQNRLEPNALTEIMRHTDLKMTQHYKHRKTEELICLLDQALA